MGAARGHVDRLAAQRGRLAGALRADSVGLWRDRPQAGAGGAGSHSAAERRGGVLARAVCCEKCGVQWEAIEFFRLPDRPRLGARFRSALREERRGQGCGVTKWRFNGWAKYENHLRDEAAGRADTGPAWPSDRGSRIWCSKAAVSTSTARACCLPPRNACSVRCRRAIPDLAREEIEAALRDYLGIDRVLWLRNGIAGDDTHGHMDDLARFVGPRHGRDGDRGRSHPTRTTQPLRENWEILKRLPGARDANCRCLRRSGSMASVCPQATRTSISRIKIVLVPTFNDPNDRIALNILAECFPGRHVIGINCVELVWGLGTLHCMTQQQPAAGA